MATILKRTHRRPFAEHHQPARSSRPGCPGATEPPPRSRGPTSRCPSRGCLPRNKKEAAGGAAAPRRGPPTDGTRCRDAPGTDGRELDTVTHDRSAGSSIRAGRSASAPKKRYQHARRPLLLRRCDTTIRFHFVQTRRAWRSAAGSTRCSMKLTRLSESQTLRADDDAVIVIPGRSHTLVRGCSWRDRSLLIQPTSRAASRASSLVERPCWAFHPPVVSMDSQPLEIRTMQELSLVTAAP